MSGERGGKGGRLEGRGGGRGESGGGGQALAAASWGEGADECVSRDCCCRPVPNRQRRPSAEAQNRVVGVYTRRGATGELSSRPWPAV
jgi:hypothetical protein